MQKLSNHEVTMQRNCTIYMPRRRDDILLSFRKGKQKPNVLKMNLVEKYTGGANKFVRKTQIEARKSFTFVIVLVSNAMVFRMPVPVNEIVRLI